MGRTPKIKLVYMKTKGHCYYCGCELDYDYFEVDHIIPKVKHGTNDLSNLAPSCSDCNAMKSTKTTEEFRVAIMNKLYESFSGRIIKKYFPVKKQWPEFYFERIQNGTEKNVHNGNM